MITLLLLAIGALIIEIFWSPRIEITREKEVLLFYSKGYSRYYLKLFKL
jgi:hypothetical protein